jgi:hypothetical protein
MTLVLHNCGFWPIVDGSETKPDAAVKPADHVDWCLHDWEVQLQIILALKKSRQNCVFYAKTAKECWDQLKARYHSAGDQWTVFLMEKILLSTLVDSKPLQPQIDSIIFTLHQAKTAGKKFTINDGIIAYILILCLPESYSTLRAILVMLQQVLLLNLSVSEGW